MNQNNTCNHFKTKELTKISIKLPQNHMNFEMYHFLLHLLVEHEDIITQMRNKIRQVRCWLNFFSDVEGCSPQDAIVERLSVLKNVIIQKYDSGFWG